MHKEMALGGTRSRVLHRKRTIPPAGRIVTAIILCAAFLASLPALADVPTATNVSISGNAIDGEQLTGTYTYGDADLDPEGATTYRWLRNGTTEVGTSINYTLTAGDIGSTIVFEVTPVATTDTGTGGGVTGLPVASAPLGPVVANSAPTASLVVISGTPVEGQTLNGSYSYSDVEGDQEGNSVEEWLRGGTTQVGIGSSYQLQASDVGFTMVYRVTPVAQTGTSPGTPVSSAPVGPVTAANTPPVATNQTVNIDEDNPANIVLTATDDDGDSLAYTILSGPANGSLGPQTGPGGRNVTYTPNSNFNGQDNFTFRANDGTANSNTATVTINVAAQNDPPTTLGISNQNATEDVPFSLNVSNRFDDVEDNNLSYTATGLPPSLAPISANGIIDGTPTQAEAETNNGVYNVVVTATDSGGLSVQAPFTLTVGAVNDAPVANNQNVNVDEDSSVNITLTATDADGDALTYSIVDGPTDGSLGPQSGPGGQNVTYTPNENFNGQDTFTFRANDGTTNSNTATVTINVAPVNDPPEATQIPDQTATEDEFFTLNVSNYVDDVDGDNLTYSASGLPASLAPIGSASGVIDGTPTQAEAEFNGGIYNVTVSVTDNNSPPVNIAFQLRVIPVNDPPEANNVNANTDEDMSVAVVLSATDVDGDSLTYIVVSGPSNGTLSGAAPNLTYTPNANYNGNDNFTYVANDGIVNSNTATVSISINPVNDIPVLDSPIADQQAVEASPFNLDISANFVDADGEALTYSATGLPPSGNITFNPNNGRFSGTPQFDDARDTPYPITVTATDGAGQLSIASDLFQLTVAALDRANVGLQISAAPTPAMLNDEVLFRFSINNIGPQGGQNIDLEGKFVGQNLAVTPSGATTCTTQSPNNSETNFSCMLGDLGIGATTSLSISATSPNAGSILVAATAAGQAAIPIDPDETNNSRYVAVGVAEQFSNGSVQVLGNSQILSMAAGDLNNDGADDIVLGTVAGLPALVFLSDGYRAFGAPMSIGNSSAHNGIALADFNNDGALDVVFANAGVPDTVFANSGSGTFSLLATLPGNTLSNAVAVGDFNNDNNMDIVFAVSGGNPVYTGNGSGGFNLADTLGSADSRDVAVGLVDGNGRPDIVVANVGGNSALWVGNASAAFPNNPTRSFNIGDANSVVIAELVGGNNSQALDVAFGRIPTAVGDIPENPVMSNNGSGGLSISTRLGTAPTHDILAGDVNRDGQNDLVFVNETGVHQIWYRSGSGFDLHVEQVVADGAIAGVLAELGEIEIGDDGGVDLAMGGLDIPGAGVFLNDGFGNLGKGDAVVPTMTLNGDNPLSFPAGNQFFDPGVTAIDNIDGDISSRVVATGNVNAQVVGDYLVTYNVADAAGNMAAPITRTVTVVPGTGTGGGGGGAVSQYLLYLLLGMFLISRAARGRYIPDTRNQNNGREDS